MGRLVALFSSAFLALLLLPPAADAQEFAYLLEDNPNVMVSRCGFWPTDHCLSRLLTVDLQERKVIRSETLSERTFGSLARSAAGRTLVWVSWGYGTR